MDYKSKITGFGDMALDFLNENMLILFNEDAPLELAELSVLHEKQEMANDVCVGDVISLGNDDYIVTAIGSEANDTLKTLGHCCLVFSGKDEVELPGQIQLKGEKLPDIKKEDYIKIKFLGGNR
ncbi:PTS glucitol/sorbitol transporter subunit IIA [Anaerofustis sp.]|uniref:PTS glucitol/sorbitol transporter subunit IIA n=1 Tax=Anaerofustis sp. TaxID=1872517 RepID=UPI0025B9CF82|nr:PTS glucitol/sorbitol transporter subunit IIA [Anaerofustis sp.]